MPIVMVTAKAAEIDRILGLELGADDYITKPFSPRELILRIKKILQRSQTAAEEPAVLKFGDLVIDAPRHLVSWHGKHDRPDRHRIQAPHRSWPSGADASNRASNCCATSGITTAWWIPGPWTRTCAACGKSSAPPPGFSIRCGASATGSRRLEQV